MLGMAAAETIAEMGRKGRYKGDTTLFVGKTEGSRWKDLDLPQPLALYSHSWLVKSG